MWNEKEPAGFTVPAQQYKHSLFLWLLLPSIFDQTKTKTKTKMATLYLALDILKKLIFNPQGKSYRAEDKRNKLITQNLTVLNQH